MPVDPKSVFITTAFRPNSGEVSSSICLSEGVLKVARASWGVGVNKGPAAATWGAIKLFSADF